MRLLLDFVLLVGCSYPEPKIVTQYFGESFVLSCTARCNHSNRKVRHSNGIKWLREVEDNKVYDLGFETVELDGSTYEYLEERPDNAHYPAIFYFQKRKCEAVSKLYFESISPVETGRYICIDESGTRHDSYIVTLIESEERPSHFMELLLSATLFLVLLIALIITVVQHYRPKRNSSERNAFL